MIPGAAAGYYTDDVDFSLKLPVLDSSEAISPICDRVHEVIVQLRIKTLTLAILKATFCPKYKNAKIFENHLNPVMLVFIG